MSNTRIDNNNTELQSILDTINALPDANEGGTDTSDATATSADIMLGETAYIADGKTTGTFTIQEEIDDIDTRITNIKTILAGKAAGGTDTSDATATAEDIMFGETAYVNGGKVTGTFSLDSELAEQDATIESIAEAVNEKMLINSGDSTLVTSIINRTITEINDNNLTTAGDYAFCSCYALKTVNFPICSIFSNYAFANCTSLSNLSIPSCTSIGGSCFRNCAVLSTVSLPVCTNINTYAFYNCRSLTSVNLLACINIGSYAFSSCSKLMNLTLGASSVATLSNTNAFTNTPMSVSTLTGTFGSIYVPASLVSAYKSATNWATYSSRITAIV